MRTVDTDRYLFIDAEAGVIRLGGAWSVRQADRISNEIRRHQQALQGLSPAASVDLTQVEELDTVGAWLLRQTFGRADASWRMTPQQKKLLALLPEDLPCLATNKVAFSPRQPIETLGRAVAGGAVFFYKITAFSGQVFTQTAADLCRPHRMRWAAISRHIFETGIAAMPIIGLLGFLMSMVVFYQGAIQLQKFGADIFTVDLTVISMLREMAPLVTAIMVAGRSGSAFAAEVGVMRLRKETDALEAMGLDPIRLLVVPRMIALLVTLPLLTFFADVVGLAGGALIAAPLIDLTLHQYIARIAEVATPTMYAVGLVKAPVFALIIALICTYHGMHVGKSAESLGRVTTVSVVQSIFMVILADAAFSILFAQLGV